MYTLTYTYMHMYRFSEAAELVMEHSIDGATLLKLPTKDLEEDLKIPKLKAKRLMKEINMDDHWVYP
jgi:hypothetical protein